MRLVWSRFAVADRDPIFTYIEAESPQAAVNIDTRIGEQVNELARFPEMGRSGRVAGTRELVVSRTPYIVAYRVESTTVRILRVLHGARLWPDAMPHEERS